MPPVDKPAPARSHSSDQSRRRLAIRSPATVVLFVIAAAVALAADLLSKEYVFESFLSDPALRQRIGQLQARLNPELSAETILRHREIRPFVQRQVCPGLRFTLSVNPGVVFGLRVPRAMIAVSSIAAFALVVFLFATSDAKAWSAHLAMALLLAGALGNLYDRLLGEVVLPGLEPIRHQVRDFIDCGQLYYPWVFNLADAFLVAGAAVLLLHWWRSKAPAKAKPSGASKTRRHA